MPNARIVLLVGIAFLLISSAALLQAKDYPMGIAPKQTITFSAPTVVGGTLLPAGDYTVLHEMQGQTHIMVFKAVKGTAEAKAKCNLVPLSKKASQTEQRYTENAKNERVLTEMVFRGDSAKHVLEQ